MTDRAASGPVGPCATTDTETFNNGSPYIAVDIAVKVDAYAEAIVGGGHVSFAAYGIQD